MILASVCYNTVAIKMFEKYVTDDDNVVQTAAAEWSNRSYTAWFCLILWYDVKNIWILPTTEETASNKL